MLRPKSEARKSGKNGINWLNPTATKKSEIVRTTRFFRQGWESNWGSSEGPVRGEVGEKGGVGTPRAALSEPFTSAFFPSRAAKRRSSAKRQRGHRASNPVPPSRRSHDLRRPIVYFELRKIQEANLPPGSRREVQDMRYMLLPLRHVPERDRRQKLRGVLPLWHG